MIDRLTSIFQRRDPEREAAMALARITSLTDMDAMPYRSGVYDDRRVKKELHTVLGVWLAPVAEEQPIDEVSLTQMQHCACCDIRAMGFGLISLGPVVDGRYVLGIPNGTEPDAGWKFFVVSRCHMTARPGGWYSTGMKVEQLHEPTELQNREFADLLAAHDVALNRQPVTQ